MGFSKDASEAAARLIRFTREDEDSKWDDPPGIAFVNAPEGKREMCQNVFILEGETILVSGNYLTLFDIRLNQL